VRGVSRRPNPRMQRTRSRASLARSPVMRSPLGPTLQSRNLLLVSVTLLMAVASDTLAQGKSSTKWQSLDHAWETYRAKPTAENGKAVADLLPTRAQARNVPAELVEKFYSSLAWLQPRILGGDRWATRVAFRLSAVADAGFAEDLDSVLGGMISRQPLLFLEELKRNRRWVPHFADIVLSLDIDTFSQTPAEVQKGELQARLDALQSLDLASIDLMDLRSECLSLLGEEITHGFGPEED